MKNFQNLSLFPTQQPSFNFDRPIQDQDQFFSSHPPYTQSDDIESYQASQQEINRSQFQYEENRGSLNCQQELSFQLNSNMFNDPEINSIDRFNIFANSLAMEIDNQAQNSNFSSIMSMNLPADYNQYTISDTFQSLSEASTTQISENSQITVLSQNLSEANTSDNEEESKTKIASKNIKKITKAISKKAKKSKKQLKSQKKSNSKHNDSLNNDFQFQEKINSTSPIKIEEGRIKFDQGLKPLLRGIRACLVIQFEDSGVAVGKYHWADERLFIRTQEFMKKLFKTNKDFTDYEVSIMIVLLYPAKAIENSKKKSCQNMPSCQRVYENLGNKGTILFKKFFENNNKKTRQEFFNHKFIRMLWPIILNNIQYEDCFERAEPNSDIMPTYAKITSKLEEDFGLTLPTWWIEKFGRHMKKNSKK